MNAVIIEFIQAARNLQEVCQNHQRPSPPKKIRMPGYILSESYGKLIEDIFNISTNPNDPTGAGDLIDRFDMDLQNLIEEYRAIIKIGLQERMREEAPARKVTVDVKAFSHILIAASEEINEKGRKVIERRTKEGYFTGVDFAGKNLKPYKIKIDFKMPYDQTVIEALQTRSTSNLIGVLDEQGKQINRIVTDGALNGDTVREIAKRIDVSVDGIGRVRATTIARTELMQGVNEGIRRRFESSGISHLKRVETQDSRICTDWEFNGTVIAGRTWKGCISIAGKVFSLADAALIDANVHPNERGTWVPYIPGLSPPSPIAEES